MKERLDLDHDDLCRIVRWYLRSQIYMSGSPICVADPEIGFFVDHLTPDGDPISVRPRVEITVGK